MTAAKNQWPKEIGWIVGEIRIGPGRHATQPGDDQIGQQANDRYRRDCKLETTQVTHFNPQKTITKEIWRVNPRRSPGYVGGL